MAGNTLSNTPASKIPATVVTGFLGAGKSTLIRSLINNAHGKRLALIINEFGDVGVDGDVLKACGSEGCTEEDSVELANGCICCTVADDFLPTMKKLIDRPSPPDHIIIETSGLALPKPLVQAFNWPEIRTRVTVDGVVTLVDADAMSQGRFVGDEDALATQRAQDDALDHESPIEELFEDQLQCADLIVLTKTDLIEKGQTDQIEADLRTQTRPGVHFLQAVQGGVSPEALLGLDLAVEHQIDERHSHHDDEGDHDHDDFDSFVLELDECDDPDALAARIRKTAIDHDVLRIKGFIAVKDKEMRLQVQAVGPRVAHHFDRAWRPDEARKSRLVVIGCSRLDRLAISKALDPGQA